MRFHAVMVDETGCEFGVTFDASSRDAAYDFLDEQYPESGVAQLETTQDAADRQRAIWASLGEY